MSLPHNAPKPPSLNDLMLQFVNRPVTAESIEAEIGAMGDVAPHEVAVGFRIEPRLAWQEALAVATLLGVKMSGATAPSEWSALVVRQESTAALPMALGHYPQQVRDLTALLQTADLSKLRPTCIQRPASMPLNSWVKKQNDVSSRLLAVALLRASDDLSAASALLESFRGELKGEWQALADNEAAAIAWQSGDVNGAVAIWKQLPESTVTQFNLGMAALFTNEPARAIGLLRRCVASIPESDAWHHLASLYLSLAEMKV